MFDVYMSVEHETIIMVLLLGCNDIYVREGVHSVIVIIGDVW